MLVNFRNNTSSPIYLSAIQMSVDAGATITTRRTTAQLDAEQQLKCYVQAGQVVLTFTAEACDAVGLGSSSGLVSYTNITRPAANTVPAFTAIWNTDDNATNWSDGVAWRDADGTLT